MMISNALSLCSHLLITSGRYDAVLKAVHFIWPCSVLTTLSQDKQGNQKRQTAWIVMKQNHPHWHSHGLTTGSQHQPPHIVLPATISIHCPPTVGHLPCCLGDDPVTMLSVSLVPGPEQYSTSKSQVNLTDRCFRTGVGTGQQPV